MHTSLVHMFLDCFEIPNNILHKNVTQNMRERQTSDIYRKQMHTCSLVCSLNQPRVCFTFFSTLHEPISRNGKIKKNLLCTIVPLTI
jgi:hypothetical protein